MTPFKILLLGGARSGKSALAERLCLASALRPVYLATAKPFDADFRARIEAHQARRGLAWQLIEAPHDPAAVLLEAAASDCVLLDSVTVWLATLMHEKQAIALAVQELKDAVMRCPGGVILVSDEVGLSVHPETALGRRFRDEAGLAHQVLAEACASVALVVAGLPLMLKGALPHG